MTRLTRLEVESAERPLAVEAHAPRFSWVLEAEHRDVTQRTYRIGLRDVRSGDVVWDSGVVSSAETFGVTLPAGILAEGRPYEWDLEVELSDGSRARATDAFETAPAEDVWTRAEWITRKRGDYQHDDHRPIPYLRTRVRRRHRVVRARLHATAGGIYDLWLGGTRISVSSMGPGWTDYSKRIQFHTYDVTAEVNRETEFYVGAVVADGWYAGGVGPFHRRNWWGKHPALRAVLVLEYPDGEVEIVGTGLGWEGAFGPIQSADLLQGEVFDARLDIGDWAGEGGNGSWSVVDIVDGPPGTLVSGRIRPPAPIAEIPAISRTEPSPGTFVFDLGQNFAGRVRLRAPGAPGAIVRLRHGEVLDEGGALYTANLRGARATDTFILDEEPRTYEPRFTIHGFRFVEVTGYPGTPPMNAVMGVPVSSIDHLVGKFETDCELLNRLHANIQWSILSNFIEVPTDCPSRDERMGWTGDAQVIAPTAVFAGDLEAFFDKWLDDVLDTSSPDGALPDVAPNHGIFDWTDAGSSGWAEAAIFVPWVSYRTYGDERILAKAFDAARRWIEYVSIRTEGLIWRTDRNTDYGDWLAPVDTPKDLIATAYFAEAVRVTRDFAVVLKQPHEAERLSRLHERIKNAFRQEFVAADGKMVAGTQTAYSLAFRFGLLSETELAGASNALAADVEERGTITAGFLAVSHIMPALSAAGRDDLAYGLLLEENYPSWLFQVRNGATTTWERWDAWRPDVGFQDPLMNSFNHFALGSVGEWLYHHAAGLMPLEPGYRSFRIRPAITKRLSRVELAYDSKVGRIGVAWRRENDALVLEVDVPTNTHAILELDVRGLTEHGVPVADVRGVREVRESPHGISVVLGSGSYCFEGSLVPPSPPAGK